MKTTRTMVALALSLMMIFSLLLTACAPKETVTKEPKAEAGTAEDTAAGAAASAAEEADKTEGEAADTEADDATTPADKAAPSGQSVEALRGGKAVVGITQEPDFLDPYLAVAAGTKEILFNIFEGLTKMTPEGKFRDCLAESHTVEDEGRRYVFTLRQGVSFHNGQPLTEEDVIASLRRAAGLDGEKALLSQLANVSDVRKGEAPMTVVVEQKMADPDLLGFLTCPILPQNYDKQKERPVGTGPFQFASYIPQVGLTLKRFEKYWNPEIPFLDEVEFKIYSNMDAAAMELMSGQIDIFPYLTHEKAGGLGEDYRINKGGANMVQLLALNNARGPLRDERVRKALNLAIDRARLIELIMGSYGTPLASGMSPEMGDFFNADLKAPERDLEQAKALLKEAGCEDGVTITVSVPGNYLIHVDTANVLAAQAKEAGIELKIETVEWGTWLEKIYSGRDFEATVIALTFEYTPSDVMNRYATDAPNNFINFSDDHYDELVKKAASETDEAVRVEEYREMQQILADKTASIFLQDPQNLTAVRACLGGYVQYPAYVQDMSLVYYTDPAAMEASLTD